jgi:hypothetical protein
MVFLSVKLETDILLAEVVLVKVADETFTL